MDGSRFQWVAHVHGTLGADFIAHYKMPCNATIVQVDTCSTADAHGAFILGTDADDNGYITSYVPGHNAVPDTRDRGDFNGALNADTAECPHVTKGTVLLATWTDNTNTDADLVVTFLEG